MIGLFLGRSPDELIANVSFATELFEHFGMIINWEKSIIQPAQFMEFLGMIRDSEHCTFSIPCEWEKICEGAKSLLPAESVSGRDLSAFISRANFCFNCSS